MKTQAKPEMEYKTRMPKYMLDHSCSKCGKECFTDLCPKCDRKIKIQTIKAILNHEQKYLVKKPDFNLVCKIYVKHKYLCITIKSSLFEETKRANMVKPRSLITLKRFFRSFFPDIKFIMYVQACNVQNLLLAIKNMNNDRINMDIGLFRLGKDEFDNISHFFDIDQDVIEEVKMIISDEYNKVMIQHNQNFKAYSNRIDRNNENETKFLSEVWNIAEKFGYSLKIHDTFRLQNEFTLDFMTIPKGDLNSGPKRKSRKNRNR